MFFQIIFWVQAGMKSGESLQPKYKSTGFSKPGPFKNSFCVQAGMKSSETHLYNQNIKAQVFPNLDLFKVLFVSKLA